MQPQDPNNMGYAQQPAPQPQMPMQQAAPMPQQPAMAPQPAYQYQQPMAPGATSLPFPIISVVLGGLSVILFGVMYGLGFFDLKYYLFLIPLVVSAGGVFVGMMSVKDKISNSVNVLALIGLIVSLTMVSMSLSFTIGHAMLKHKASASSSYSY